MKHLTIVVACISILGLSACENMTTEQRTVAGVAGGAAAGLITAEALGANNNWRLISALAGAAAGTVVAQNQARNLCAYSRGDGTYYEAQCPRNY
jgi:outer membrane lipoprotein SlyB